MKKATKLNLTYLAVAILLGLLAWSWSNISEKKDIKETIATSLFGSTLSGLLVIVGWHVTSQNSLRQQRENIRHQILEKTIAMMLGKIGEYKDWMIELNGKIEMIKEKGTVEQFVTHVDDWTKFSTHFGELQVKDVRNSKWMDALVNNFVLFKEIKVQVIKGLLKRQLSINVITRNLSYCTAGTYGIMREKYIRDALENHPQLQEQLEQIGNLRSYFTQLYHEHVFPGVMTKEEMTEFYFDVDQAKIVAAKKFEI
jgi:hypothetical protein